MNELIAKTQFHILALPIGDPMKNYYYNFLESVRMSTATPEKKLQRLGMLLEAVKSRFTEHFLKTPLVQILGTVVLTLQDIGKGAITGLETIPPLLKPVNIILIISVMAVLGFVVFLIIGKLAQMRSPV